MKIDNGDSDIGVVRVLTCNGFEHDDTVVSYRDARKQNLVYLRNSAKKAVNSEDRLGMMYFCHFNGLEYDGLLGDEIDTCGTSCCLAGWAANWGIGNTEKYIRSEKGFTSLFNYNLYSQEQFCMDALQITVFDDPNYKPYLPRKYEADKLMPSYVCDVPGGETNYVHIWSFLFAEDWSNSWEECVARLDIVINQEWHKIRFLRTAFCCFNYDYDMKYTTLEN